MVGKKKPVWNIDTSNASDNVKYIKQSTSSFFTKYKQLLPQLILIIIAYASTYFLLF